LFTSFYNIRSIARIFWKKIKMMSCTRNKDIINLWWESLADTSSTPWIKISVWKNDIRNLLKVKLRCLASEIIYCVIILRSQTIFFLTRFSVFIFIEIGPGKARGSRIISLRHWEIITKLNIPTWTFSSFSRLIFEACIRICLFCPKHNFWYCSLYRLNACYVKILKYFIFINNIFDFFTNWFYRPSINRTYHSRIVCLSVSSNVRCNCG